MAEYTPEEKRRWKLEKWSDEALLKSYKAHARFIRSLEWVMAKRGLDPPKEEK